MILDALVRAFAKQLLLRFVDNTRALLFGPSRSFLGKTIPLKAERPSTRWIGAPVYVLPEHVAVLVAAIERIAIAARAALALD